MRKVYTTGRKPTINLENKPLLAELYNAGYNRVVICRHLELSTTTWLNYFTNPMLLNLEQFMRIAYLLNKPLSYVINLGLNYKPGSVQWVNESVNHVNLGKTH